MASNYVKLDSKVFKERLSNKQYANATGARRAVGKSEMSQADKDSCYALINKTFGVSAAPAKTPGAPKAKRAAVAKKTAAVKTPAAKKSPRAKKTTTPKKSASARGKGSDAEGAPAAQELADLQAGATVTQTALAGLAAAAELDPSIDVRAAAKQGAEILQHSIDRIDILLGRRAESLPDKPPVEDTDKRMASNPPPPVAHDEGPETSEDDDDEESN